MLRWISCLSLVTLLFVVLPSGGQAAEGGYVPGIKILLEVRTPDGFLRSFQTPGAPPTYWSQDLPVVQGDKVTINPMISLGGAELGKVIVRLDQKPMAERTERPWRVEVDTADLAPGYHMAEVWASTKSPGANANSASTTFLVVPQNDPLLRVMQAGSSEPSPPIAEEDRLACAIRSRDPKVDQEIMTSSTATVTAPTLFFCSAGPDVKEYFYTLTRDGRVTYTSYVLPKATDILLEPQKAEGLGLAEGTVILTVRAGDGAGRFGAPCWVTVNIGAVKSGEGSQ